MNIYCRTSLSSKLGYRKPIYILLMSKCLFVMWWCVHQTKILRLDLLMGSQPSFSKTNMTNLERIEFFWLEWGWFFVFENPKYLFWPKVQDLCKVVLH